MTPTQNPPPTIQLLIEQQYLLAIENKVVMVDVFILSLIKKQPKMYIEYKMYMLLTVKMDSKRKERGFYTSIKAMTPTFLQKSKTLKIKKYTKQISTILWTEITIAEKMSQQEVT